MDNPTLPRGDGRLLDTTVFVCGAAVLIEEILGTRVLTPFFGSTVYVWSSLITVALGFLAAGYLVGGWAADRARPRCILYGAVFLAGVFILTVYPLRGLVLPFADRFGVRAGPLVAATILFGVSFTLMGTVTPCAVRLVADDTGRLGRRVGRIFALSTGGSLVGALLSGFFLIQFLSSKQILCGTAALLIVLGVCGLIRHRGDIGSWPGRALLAAVLLLTVVAAVASAAIPSPPREGAKVVHSSENAYGLLRIVDIPGDDLRYLTINNFGQTAVRTSSRDRNSHIPIMALPIADLPPESSILLLGLGGGQLISDFDRPGMHWDIVELDPDVPRVAREFMDFKPDAGRHRVYIEDARAFLRKRPGGPYDLIVVDLYSGFTIPSHMLTEEAMRLVRDRLRPGGLAVFHVIGRTNGEDAFINGVTTTARAVFPAVHMATEDEDEFQPVLVFASPAPLDTEQLNLRITEHNRQFGLDKGLIVPAPSGLGRVYHDDDQTIDLLWQHNTVELRRQYMQPFMYPVDY